MRLQRCHLLSLRSAQGSWMTLRWGARCRWWWEWDSERGGKKKRRGRTAAEILKTFEGGGQLPSCGDVATVQARPQITNTNLICFNKKRNKMIKMGVNDIIKI